jgi:hypothetical protein
MLPTVFNDTLRKDIQMEKLHIKENDATERLVITCMF